MSIYVGNTKIGQIYLGSTNIAQAYLGSAKVYQNGLPYDMQVEYLESSGTQYIDTGVYGDLNTSLEVKFNIDSSSSNSQSIAGDMTTATKSITIFEGITNAYQRFGDKTVVYQYTRGTDYVVKTNKDGLFVNGQKIDRTTTNSFTTSGNLYLMCANGVDASISKLIGKVYYCKIWNNDTLVRDFIPVRVGTVGYMYDKVSRQLFGNSGTGDFILGQDIVPVEYLRSSASGELIDTGVSDIDKLEIKFRYGAYAQYYGMFGNYKDETSNTWRLIHSTMSSSANLLGYVNTKANGGNTNIPIATTGVDHTLVMSQTEIIYDGVTYSGTINMTQGTSNIKNIAIFARNLDDPVWSNIYMRCYYFKAWKNGNLVCDLIPVRIGQRGYMYNRVGGNMIAAYGGGDFILGNDITT